MINSKAVSYTQKYYLHPVSPKPVRLATTQVYLHTLTSPHLSPMALISQAWLQSYHHRITNTHWLNSCSFFFFKLKLGIRKLHILHCDVQPTHTRWRNVHADISKWRNTIINSLDCAQMCQSVIHCVWKLDINLTDLHGRHAHHLITSDDQTQLEGRL